MNNEFATVDDAVIEEGVFHSGPSLGTSIAARAHDDTSEQVLAVAGKQRESGKDGLKRMIQLTTLEAQLQAVRQENTELIHDLGVATKELNELRDDTILSKRKIELRERFLTDKERQMVEWESRLQQAE